MAQETLYLKAERNVEVTEEDVFLKDVAKVFCQDPVLLSKCNSLKIKKSGKTGRSGMWRMCWI